MTSERSLKILDTLLDDLCDRYGIHSILDILLDDLCDRYGVHPTVEMLLSEGCTKEDLLSLGFAECFIDDCLVEEDNSEKEKE